MAIKNVSDLYLYPNTARAVRVTGREVKDWLERSAGIFNQVSPGAQDVVLLNPAFPSYNFDVIDGVEYEIDLSQPSKFDLKGVLMDENANRIVNLTYNGAPLDMDAEFIIAVIVISAWKLPHITLKGHSHRRECRPAPRGS